MASNFCFCHFRLVMKLVSSSAFLILVYVMEITHSWDFLPQCDLFYIIMFINFNFEHQ
jgi:hypothetical protein